MDGRRKNPQPCLAMARARRGKPRYRVGILTAKHNPAAIVVVTKRRRVGASSQRWKVHRAQPLSRIMSASGMTARPKYQLSGRTR